MCGCWAGVMCEERVGVWAEAAYPTRFLISIFHKILVVNFMCGLKLAPWWQKIHIYSILNLLMV